MCAAPVTRQTLREQVLRILREEILNGVYQPGERLSEPELAKRLDVSLTPVREALGDLAASGLVVRNGRLGTHVRRIGVQDAVNLLAVRKSLEILAVRQAVTNLTAADDAIIRRLVKEQSTATDRTKADPESAIPVLGQLNEEFHQLILKRTGNQWLISMLASIQDLLLFVRTELRKSTSVKRRRESLTEHRQIAEALLARDADAAAAAMGQHVANLEGHVVQLIQHLDDSSTTGASRLARSRSQLTKPRSIDDIEEVSLRPTRQTNGD
ncbi:MAG TPA: GntR family transcriptional regulator [Trueperaceae bacterium]|nr:GntR family transcriptional regulator [Trueperaceae bacterium]